MNSLVLIIVLNTHSENLIINLFYFEYKSIERKCAIMKNTRKNIVIAISILTLCTTLAYTYSKLGEKQNNGTRINTLTKTSFDNRDGLTSNSNGGEGFKATDDIKLLEFSSSNIVIYNTHSEEAYPSGRNITEVGSLINDRLVSEGLNSQFIKSSQSTTYEKAYEASRELIELKVKDYESSILLDIHRNVSNPDKSDTKKILLVVAKESPHYEANNVFANQLLQEILKSSNIEASIFYFNTGVNFFNQDLSNKAVLVELGNDKSSDNDIEECMNALVISLKNIESNQSN